MKFFRRYSLAHHLSFMFYLDQVPPFGKIVCHTCDTPACVNPMHLYLGTAKQNRRDSDKRLRSVRLVGEDHPRHVLTDKKVRWMRDQVAKGASISSVAKKLGLWYGVAYSAIKGWTWGHVA